MFKTLACTSVLLLGLLHPVAWANPEAFRDGASMRSVLRSMGKPNETQKNEKTQRVTWKYGSSWVTFQNDLAIEWHNAGNLKVFSGHKRERALPIRDGGSKTDWEDRGNLKVSIGDSREGAPPWFLGAARRDVVAANGTPNHCLPDYKKPLEEWRFGSSKVYLRNTLVIGYENRGNLKVRELTVRKDAPGIRLGIPRDEVGAVLGTPEAILPSFYRKDGTYVRSHFRTDAD